MGTREIVYILVILFANVLQDKGLDRIIIDGPDMMTTNISGLIWRGEGALKPDAKSLTFA